MDRKSVEVTIAMESYIAEPYWPELDEVVTIQKKSGMNRAQSDAKRDLALKNYLAKIEMTWQAYESLIARSQRKWYRSDGDPHIIVPRHQLAGMCVQCIKTSTSTIRGKFSAESFRSHVLIDDFITDREVADDVYDRWGTMIVPGKTKGSHRLQEPTGSEKTSS